MNNRPLVSIIIPTHNQKDSYLIDCIESAINQTYENIEIVISDNYSTNNAKNIILEYVSRENNIRIVSPPAFVNMSESFLYVFTQAIGDYVCYLSSDDVLLPNCIETLIQPVLDNNDVVFAHGQAIYFDKNEKEVLEWVYFDNKSGIYGLNKEVVERLLNFSYVCFAGCLIKKNVWSEITKELYDKNLVVGSCLDILVTSILFDKGSLFYHNYPLAKVRIENENRNTIESKLIRDKVLIFNYWDDNKTIFNKISTVFPEYFDIKNAIYIKMATQLFYEYLNKIIDLSLFRNTKKELESFKINPSLKYFSILTFIDFFPNSSIKIYQMLKRILK